MKRLVRLRDRRHRNSAGLFVVEGERLFSRALQAGLEPIEVYVASGHVGEYPKDAVMVAEDVLDRVSYRKTNPGILAVFPQEHLELADIRLSPSPLVLVCESIEKPGNLGAMARTASAVTADALVCVGNTVDKFNPNALTSSTGALFDMPTVNVSIPELTDWLADNDIELIAASPEASTTYWHADMSSAVALAVGAEDSGLSPALRQSTAQIVAIPMMSTVDSLNASVSLGLLAYEAIRQRS